MYNSYGTFYHNGYSELYHHGVKGQKHGTRRWQNPDGSLTPEGYIHYGYAKETFKRRNKKMAEKISKEQHAKMTVPKSYDINDKALQKRNEYVLKRLPKEIKRYGQGKTAKSIQGVSNMYDNWRKTTHDPKILGGMVVQQLLIGGAVGNALAIAHRNHRYKKELIRNGKYYMDKTGYTQAKKLIETTNKIDRKTAAKVMTDADVSRFKIQVQNNNKDNVIYTRHKSDKDKKVRMISQYS